MLFSLPLLLCNKASSHRTGTFLLIRLTFRPHIIFDCYLDFFLTISPLP